MLAAAWLVVLAVLVLGWCLLQPCAMLQAGCLSHWPAAGCVVMVVVVVVLLLPPALLPFLLLLLAPLLPLPPCWCSPAARARGRRSSWRGPCLRGRW